MQTSRKLRALAALMTVVAILVLGTTISSGAPLTPGHPSLQTACVDSPSATGPTTVNVPASIQNLSDLGGAAYTLFLEAPSAATVSGGNAGPEFSAWCTGIGGTPQFARTDIADDANCGAPHTAGTNCYQIDVFCFALGGLSGGVQPAINSQITVQAPVGTHNLTVVPALVNGSLSQVFDSAGASAPLSPINNAIPTIVIGDVCGPTAVTMSGMSANSASPVASSLPLILGGAAVAVGGAVAFLRRKR